MDMANSEKMISPDIEAFEAMKILDAGDTQTAIQRCHDALSHFGPNRNCFLVKARAHLSQEEYGFAEETLQSVLQIDPEHPAAWAMLGEVYFRMGRESRVEYCRQRLDNIFPALAEYLEQVDAADEDDTIYEPVTAQEPEAEPDVSDEDGEGTEPGDSAESSIAEPDGSEEIAKMPADSIEPPSIGNMESIVPFEDFEERGEKPDTQGESSNMPEEIESVERLGSGEAVDIKKERTGAWKAEIFETATFADICFNQGKFDKALKVYKKLLSTDPENAKYRERIKSIESKMSMP
jgi:tetratricopeptide (TPR) repeat protein